MRYLKPLSIIAVSAIVVLAGTLYTSAASDAPSSRTVWEYRFEESYATPPVASANQLGAAGWELIATTVQDGKYTLYYKRAK